MNAREARAVLGICLLTAGSAWANMYNDDYYACQRQTAGSSCSVHGRSGTCELGDVPNYGTDKVERGLVCIPSTEKPVVTSLIAFAGLALGLFGLTLLIRRVRKR